jgi:type IV pilus assembly protein PilY1
MSIVSFIKKASQIASISVFLALPNLSQAARTSSTDMQTYTQYPLFQNPNVPPISMLALSIDHQLFNKAYTDYTDLDGDGEDKPELTYKASVEYSGYFDPKLCYDYSGGQFSASSVMASGSCGGKWSGNFLNWVTMTRLDVLRWVLYGGKRSTDSGGVTVLERAHIPQDGHSYVKVFRAADAGIAMNSVTPYTDSVISFCNTTSESGTSESSNEPPVMQVAKGSWETWTLQELYQCDYGRGARAPETTDQLGGADFIVRVKVCTGAVRESFCKEYSPGNVKPVGLLQQYGETSNGIQFGLVSGSYDRPRSGGVLRSKIGPMSDEINLVNGEFKPSANGILKTLNLIQATRWERPKWRDCDAPGVDNSQLVNDDGNRKCAMWGNPISEIYAEALRYLAGATAGSTAFDADDSKSIYRPGMPKVAAWTDPFANRPLCTNCSVIVISTGLNSFDRDEIPAVPVAASLAADLNAATKEVGANEGLVATDFILAGQNIAGTSDLPTVDEDAATNGIQGAERRVCSPKPFLGLDQVSGVCPEVGSLQGGYGIAGLAFKAFTKDMRPTIGTGDSFFEKQNFRTYTLSLAESLPSLKFDLGGKVVTVLPFTQSSSNGNNGPYKASSIVNFKPGFLVGSLNDNDDDRAICRTAPTKEKCRWYGVRTGNTAKRGSFVINWEDSTWGNDYDQDGVQVLSYCIGPGADGCGADDDALNGADICENTGVSTVESQNPVAGGAILTTQPAPSACATAPGANTLLLRSEVVDTAAGFAIRFGWITAGTTVGTAGTNTPFYKNQNVNRNCLRGENCYANGWSRPQVVAYTADQNGTGAKLLENPLWYAAKYGNFEDTNNNGVPDNAVAAVPPVAPATVGTAAIPSEWDRLNLKGDPGSDGIPDAYFPVRNPNLLKEQLGQVFSRIAESVGSGTSAAVVSSSGEGPGAVFQAVYSESRDDKSDSNIKVRWNGTVRGLWLTPDGKFAEDTAPRDGLFSPSDKVVSFKYKVQERKTVLIRDGLERSLDEIQPIWDAEEELANVTDTQLATNRGYTDVGPGRYIFTWLDAGRDGIDATDEQAQFQFGAGGFSDTATGNWWWLNTDNVEEAKRIVNWTRGIDQGPVAADSTTTPPIVAQPAMRSRKLRFGSLPNGSPPPIRTARLGDIVNSSPLVVGAPSANIDLIYQDGSYTAFQQKYANRRNVVYVGSNSGLVHAFNGGFVKKPTAASPLRGFTKSSPGPGPAAPEHELGKELWAYAPKNLLPHLRWATEPNYTHVFYADGSPISADVRAFSDSDSDHPGGWGTILIVPFRLGGGPIQIKNRNNRNVRLAPGYVILDITNPEKPPEVIGEVVLPTDFLTDGSVTSTSPFVAGSVTKASYAFGRPAIVFNQKVGDGGAISYDYSLIIGSGPTNLQPEVHSTRKASVYTFDLKTIITNRGIAPGNAGTSVKEIATENTFISDMVTADFDLGGTSDAVYFGVSTGVPDASDSDAPNGSMTGALYKLPIEKAGPNGSNGIAQPSGEIDLTRAPTLFFDTGKPVTGRPGLSISGRNLPNVIFGTGRMLSRGDFVSGEGNSLYILDDISPFTVRAFDSAKLSSSTLPVTTGTSTNTAIDEYRTLNGERGVKLTLGTTSQNGGGQERNFTAPAIFRGIAILSQFQPDGDVCKALGSSKLAQINFANATASSVVVTGLGGGGATSGAGAGPSLYVPPDPPLCPQGSTGCSNAPPTATIISQDSTGSLNAASSIVVGTDGTGEQSWFEPREN